MTGIYIVLGVLLFFVGAAVFSFAGVVIYRLPRGMNYLTGRSICPGCQRTLAWYELMPVLSWVLQLGRCRSCKSFIGWRDFLIELLGGGLALVCWWAFGLTAATATAFIYFTILTIIAFLDADTMEIPNGLSAAIAVLAVAAYFTMPGLSILARLIGGVCVSLPLLGIAMAIEGAFGGGDIKLMAACGLFLGWQNTLLAFFLALLTGGGYAVWLLITKRKGGKEHFSFGPFLCAGCGAALLVGERIIEGYLSIFFG